MAARIFSGCILLFWLTMTGLLVQKVWYPAESRLAEVSPQVAFDLFASREETAEMDVYEDQRIVGRITLRPLALGQNSRRSVMLRMTANGFIDLPSNPLVPDGARLRLSETMLSTDRSGELQGLDLRLELDQPPLRIRVHQDETTASLEVKLRDVTVFQTGGEASSQNSAMEALAKGLLASLGISSSELDSIKAQAERDAAGITLTARHGDIEIEGVRFSGYVVTAGRASDRKDRQFHVYIDNTGELIRLDTPVYRLLARKLRPEGIAVPPEFTRTKTP